MTSAEVAIRAVSLIRPYVNVAPLLPSPSFVPAVQGAPAPPRVLASSSQVSRGGRFRQTTPAPIQYLSFKPVETQLRFTLVLICVTGGCGVYPGSQWMRGIHPGKVTSPSHTAGKCKCDIPVQSPSEGAQKHSCVVEDPPPPQRFRSLILLKCFCEQPATR